MYCKHCGVSRLDPGARFCRACGAMFDAADGESSAALPGPRLTGPGPVQPTSELPSISPRTMPGYLPPPAPAQSMYGPALQPGIVRDRPGRPPTATRRRWVLAGIGAAVLASGFGIGYLIVSTLFTS